ncbi:MAG: helix-turn-helix transcriptional regulator [Clostridiales bacterium]|nr:helix-turn-helix transcriptional regulator [Clostridiales bacterium]
MVNNGRLREVREDKDYTQEQVAIKLKITRQQYQLYESNKRKIPVDLLREFCLLFSVSSDYVLGLPKGLKWLR